MLGGIVPGGDDCHSRFRGFHGDMLPHFSSQINVCAEALRGPQLSIRRASDDGDG